MENIPKQKNSYDCGVFVLEYVRELLCGNNKPNFTNENGNMKQIRRRMMIELKKWKLLDDKNNNTNTVKIINKELNKLKEILCSTQQIKESII